MERAVDQRPAGVFPERHRRGAGVVLLALEDDIEIAAADDVGDHAELEAARFQIRPLLDMGFEIALIAIGPRRRDAIQPRRAQRLDQAAITPARPLDLLTSIWPERAAAEATEIGTLLVDPRHRIQRQIAVSACSAQRAMASSA
ncbi:MAG: hypothetical protein U1F68_03045 [Gammaproteobacteria bacterium]